MFASRLRDLVEGIGQERAHFTDEAAATNAVAELEKDRILAAGFGNKAIGDTFSHSGLAGADIAMKYHQRILFGDKLGHRKLALVMLLVPRLQFAAVEQQAQLVMNFIEAGLEAQQGLLPREQQFVGERRLVLEGTWFAHAAQSLRCTP